MLILSLGVPRSGTILVFNIVREILTRQDISFTSVNTNYPETEAFLAKYDFQENVLMHAHNVLPEVQKAIVKPDVYTFFNYRDPRDVLVSMMRLHDYSFEKCLELTNISFNHFKKAREIPGIMFIPYNHIIAATEACIFQIAQRLNIFLSLEEVKNIRKATSMEAHKKIMKDVGSEKVAVQVRRNPKRTIRESTEFFINDRHIQSGKTGRWRKELTLDQQKMVSAHFKPLLDELGFEDK
jgi:hypothetical protein